NWGAKMWRAERFAELAQRLTAPGGALAGGRVAVFGGADEREAAQPVIAAIPEARRIDLVGRTDLPVAGACLERCALYVGNDSGLMHIAAAAGAPTVGLFGPSPEWRYAPWGAHTSVVRTAESHAQLTGHAGFDHRVQDTLMDSISVETVENAARELLARAAATGPSAAQGGRA
ncbi:MAG: glycosyltransferase family 9 protein, partial [Rhodospirillales bacterium]|nr:glycosyltransferase family 9 protein [Rhodospirillales bacterium]